jgi:hypothetical protein
MEKPSTSLRALKLFQAKQQIDRLKRLHQYFEPHQGQIEAGRALFSQRRRRIFLQCGRSWGKSLFGAYLGIRFALQRPNAQVYIVLPERNQAQEIYWESGYLKRMVPPEYLFEQDETLAYNKTDLRVRLDNNSFARLLGSDNPESLRGPKPDLVIFDEYRDFKSEAYDIMEPNLLIKDSPLVLLSTPPDQEGSYTKIRDLFIDQMRIGNPRYFYMELPTETNPHMDKERLEETRQMLEKRGEHGVWLREYMAQFIPGGAKAVFPKFASNKGHIVKSARLIETLIHRDKNKLDWFCVFDPAQNSIFAVLLACINRQTGQIYVLDEIYEMDRARTGSLEMWTRALQLQEEHYPYLERWTNIYDEQAAWFFNDLERHGSLNEEVTLEPTTKQSRNKDNDMSMLKDLFSARGRIFISMKCEKTIWEVENYCTNDKGEYVKKNDHEIDNLRYLLAASDYEPAEYPDGEKKIDDAPKRQSLSFKDLFAERDKEANLNTGDMESAGEHETVFLDDLDEHEYY